MITSLNHNPAVGYPAQSYLVRYTVESWIKGMPFYGIVIVQCPRNVPSNEIEQYIMAMAMKAICVREIKANRVKILDTQAVVYLDLVDVSEQNDTSCELHCDECGNGIPIDTAKQLNCVVDFAAKTILIKCPSCGKQTQSDIK